MQILEIVLYSKRNQKRVIPFKTGRVNIITGDFATGKSSLATIVDFCLGRETYLIPEGIRKNVSWFGLRLQFPNDQMFVARENLPPGKTTPSGVYIEQGDVVLSPETAPALSNTNIEALIATLTNKIGIAPNLYTPPAGQTRVAISATIRHTLFYCIQEQGEIAAKGLLFHRQSEPFIPQTIKDTLPYFLGAIQEDRLALEQELNRARLELRRARKAWKDLETIQGGGEVKARSLLAEAYEVGLISTDESAQNIEEIVTLLRRAAVWLPQDKSFVGSSRLSQLQDEVKRLQSQFNELSIALRDAVTFAQEIEGYTSEVRQQELRLASIGLFDSHTQNAETCPVCSQSMAVPLPTTEAIRHSIEHLQANSKCNEKRTAKAKAIYR